MVMVVPKDGTYYATKTALACDPDTNTRFVYCWPSDYPVAIFNPHRDPWEAEDELDLEFFLQRLNNRNAE